MLNIVVVFPKKEIVLKMKNVLIKNGFDVELVSQDDSQLTYKIKDESGNEYTYQEDSNSVEIQADGDVADGEVEVEVSGNASDLPAADTAE